MKWVSRDIYDNKKYRDFLTFFWKRTCDLFDQCLEEAMEVETAAISTPVDKVPLKTMKSGEEWMTLVKSSHAASISSLLSFGTPEILVTRFCSVTRLVF